MLAGGVAGLGLALLARAARADAAAAMVRVRADIARSVVRRRRADLEVLDLGAEDLVVRQVLGGILGAATVLGGAVLARVTGTGPSLPLVTGAMLVGATVGFAAPDVAVRRAAALRRRHIVHAMSSFLDLTTVLLAGGAGLETALTAAARAGGGEVFGLLRRASPTTWRPRRTRPRNEWEFRWSSSSSGSSP
jgi:tight adherence protein C